MARRTKNGFTVLEIVIALAIIGLLGTISAVGVRQRMQVANVKVIGRTLENIAHASESYFIDHGTVPASVADTGYTPVPHPYGQSYTVSAIPGVDGVDVSTFIPTGKGKPIVPNLSVAPVNADWNRVSIAYLFRRPLNYQRKVLFGE